MVYCTALVGAIGGARRAVPSDLATSARAIHQSAMVVDAHEDTPQRFADDNYNVGSNDPRNTDFISLDRATAGNLGAVFFSIWVHPKTYEGHFAKRALDLIDSVYIQAARHPDRMTIALSAADIELARRQHKLAALMGIEGGHAIEDDLALLRVFYRLGVRYMTLTWSNSNDWADSSGDIDNLSVEHHNGLTPFGKQVVQEMNQLGMVVDVSHVSDKTFWDVVETTKAPIIASHSSARAVTPNGRNMSDDMLRAVEKTGGVVHINFFANFLDDDFTRRAATQHVQMVTAVQDYERSRRAAGTPVTPEDSQRFALDWLTRNPITRVPLARLIDHIDHAVAVAGIDHVGLGSDSNGLNFLPAGIDSAADLPKVTEAMVNRGYSGADITKILGGNTLRVLRDVERVSGQMKAQAQR